MSWWYGFLQKVHFFADLHSRKRIVDRHHQSAAAQRVMHLLLMVWAITPRQYAQILILFHDLRVQELHADADRPHLGQGSLGSGDIVGHQFSGKPLRFYAVGIVHMRQNFRIKAGEHTSRKISVGFEDGDCRISDFYGIGARLDFHIQQNVRVGGEQLTKLFGPS
jgi:hypothetical protein